MQNIVRTKTKATGGITEREHELMVAHSDLWIKRAMRTDPIEPDKIIPAIEGLYKAAGLKRPHVVIVPSPLVMAFAYGAAAAVWHRQKTCAATRDATDAATDDATYDATIAATSAATIAATSAATRDATSAATSAATRAATYAATDAATDAATRAATRAATDAATDAATRAATSDATYDATRAATSAATRDATYDATRDATYDATRDATYAATDDATYAASSACFDMAGDLGIRSAKKWPSAYQGGNMWAGYDCYLTAFRDILGLELESHAAYHYWEQAAIHGGFRVMHDEFCMVCDFPEVLLKDENNQPHCEVGPSHRWRDGWSLYHWHGVRVPDHWIENRANLDPVEVLKADNVEQRAAGMAIVGWPKAAKVLNRKIIDGDPETDMGALVELTMPGLPEPGRFLMARCPRNGTICEGVPHISDIDNLPIDTVIAAQAWRVGDPQSEYEHPSIRT